MQSLLTYVKNAFRYIGIEIKRWNFVREYADPQILQKARLTIERYREIVSDPLNILIERAPQAGYIDKNGYVFLHNGNRVPVFDRLAYYNEFSDFLIINRGVHEPLEEYCFQEVLKKINSTAPSMIALGAYWAHYSMWLKKCYPNAICHMVEPDQKNIEVGKNNFRINGYEDTLLKSFVSNKDFNVDKFLLDFGIDSIDILHSDIQGFEVEMLQEAVKSLLKNKIKYIFISTHSEELHRCVVAILKSNNYRIEVSSGFDLHTTSCDGFVLASSPQVDSIFPTLTPWADLAFAKQQPLNFLNQLLMLTNRFPKYIPTKLCTYAG